MVVQARPLPPVPVCAIYGTVSLDAWEPDTPWGRQPCDDTEQKWCAFLRYLEGPRPRNTRWIASALGVPAPRVARWAAVGVWEARAAAWDAEADEARLEAITAQRIALERAGLPHEAQMPILGDIRRLVALGIAKYLQAEEESDIPTLSIKELANLARVAFPAERAIAGGPARKQLDLTALSDDQLIELERILGSA